MSSPKYVLRTMEAGWAPKKNSAVAVGIKKAVRIIAAVLLIGSIVFQDNLFSELSFSTSVLLLVLFIGTFSIKDRERVPKPFEIRFYDDHLETFREKRYYSPRLSRQETEKFLYSDIKKVEFRRETQRINIYGVVEGIYYDYNKDGSLSQKPSYHKTTDSLVYFYTSAAPQVDFVAEIEAHAPVTVIVEDN